jgi:hypothetical protein
MVGREMRVFCGHSHVACDAMRAAARGSTYGIRTTSATTGSAS